MTKSYSPTIFVSSTCYDLSQIRDNIREFIESLGYDPLLSEHNTFPVDPSQNTVTNCIKNVRDRADIFVLIIGKRFGFKTEQGKSITNLEYLEAKLKGIPVYIFINKEINSIYPVWEKNPNGDYSHIVDSIGLFEFIKTIKTPDNWVFTYDSAQDICGILKNQLAYLFMDSLELMKKLREPTIKEEWLSLSPKVLNLLLYKKEGWRYLVFEQLVKEDLLSHKHLKLDIEHGIILSKYYVTEDVFDLAKIIIDYSKVLLSVLQSVRIIMEDVAPTAFEETNDDNSEKIIYLAKKFGEAYGVLIETWYEIKSIRAPNYLKTLKNMIAKICGDFTKDMEVFFDKYSRTINKELKEGVSKNKKCTIIFNLTVPDMKALYKEVEEATKEYTLQLFALEQNNLIDK